VSLRDVEGRVQEGRGEVKRGAERRGRRGDVA